MALDNEKMNKLAKIDVAANTTLYSRLILTKKQFANKEL